MSEYTEFLTRAAAKAQDDVHRRQILKAISVYEAKVAGMKERQFRDWREARRLAARVKDHALAHLPELLESFETKIARRGAKVLWAETAKEAQDLFLDIVKRHAAKKVVKSKSMTTEEVELNELLERAGVEVWESDLGELIVQLAGEKPYHIVTPAMHKSKEEIAALFHEKLGAPPRSSPEELTMIARRHLREAYVTAEIGVTGANFLIAEEGAVVITENEGNARLTLSCPPVHVVFAGIEKVLPRLTDLALFLPLLATSGTGQQLTCYNSIVRGPRQAGEADGPEHLYIILLDNGRSGIYAQEAFRSSLRCIRCGACLNACPVFRTIGGHAYKTPYQGPIGSVITPHLRGLAEWQHLPFASSLCGACSEVCPVSIDIHHLLLENRWAALQGGRAAPAWRGAMKAWAFVMASRRRLRWARRLWRGLDGLARLFLSRERRARIPRLARKSFAEVWRKNGQP
ncbi:MAG: iron-sulfur cluster-binding protein [Planctomycetes bacterium]|nr:iron-sulfur cluster-binding protein [Planctomycetota bacterium]